MPSIFGLGSDNPVGWCNFHRRGGIKTVLITAGGYAAMLGVLVVLSVGLDRHASGWTYALWMGWLLGLQVLFAVIFGAGRVSSWIRGDVNSGMMESLRMMPLPAGHAIAGYMTGTAATLCGYIVVNFVAGLLATTLAEVPPARWIAANLILFAFALFVWTIVALVALVVKNTAAVLIAVSLISLFGNAGVLYVAPGLGVLMGPMIGGTIFNLRSSQTELAAPLVVSVASQFLMGAILFAGAVRKYRRPDGLALGARLGVALVLVFVAISLLAIVMPDAFAPSFVAREFERGDRAPAVCGSAIVGMLIALVPLSNFARLHVAWIKGRLDDPGCRRTVPPPFAGAVVLTAILALLILGFPAPPGWGRAACVIAAFFGFCCSATYVAAWFYRVRESAKGVIVLWLTLYAGAPLLVDVVRDRMSDRDNDRTMATASSLSPVGLLVEAVTWPGADLRLGAVVNALVPLVPIALYLRRKAPVRRQPRVAASASAEPTSSAAGT